MNERESNQVIPSKVIKREILDATNAEWPRYNAVIEQVFAEDRSFFMLVLL